MSKQMEKSTETSGFLDGRGYTAAFLYKLIALLVGNGVYANELAPTATNENMSITHGSGHAWINGVLYENATPFVLDIATADGSLNRYDSLMLRLNLSINETYATIVQGEYAANPTPPACIRNADTYDLKICDIYIPAGCTKITQDQVIDTRLDSSVCGVPVFPVEHLDTTTFYQQISADLAKFKNVEQADFSEWVAEQYKLADELRAAIAAVKDGSGFLLKDGTAAAAKKLETARKFQVDLASDVDSSFDGTADVTPGVVNALPMKNGGTGEQNGADGLAALFAAGYWRVSNYQIVASVEDIPADAPVNAVFLVPEE